MGLGVHPPSPPAQSWGGTTVRWVPGQVPTSNVCWIGVPVVRVLISMLERRTFFSPAERFVEGVYNARKQQFQAETCPEVVLLEVLLSAWIVASQCIDRKGSTFHPRVQRTWHCCLESDSVPLSTNVTVVLLIETRYVRRAYPYP